MVIYVTHQSRPRKSLRRVRKTTTTVVKRQPQRGRIKLTKKTVVSQPASSSSRYTKRGPSGIYIPADKQLKAWTRFRTNYFFSQSTPGNNTGISWVWPSTDDQIDPSWILNSIVRPVSQTTFTNEPVAFSRSTLFHQTNFMRARVMGTRLVLRLRNTSDVPVQVVAWTFNQGATIPASSAALQERMEEQPGAFRRITLGANTGSGSTKTIVIKNAPWKTLGLTKAQYMANVQTYESISNAGVMAAVDDVVKVRCRLGIFNFQGGSASSNGPVVCNWSLYQTVRLTRNEADAAT